MLCVRNDYFTSRFEIQTDKQTNTSAPPRAPFALCLDKT